MSMQAPHSENSSWWKQVSQGFHLSSAAQVTQPASLIDPQAALSHWQARALQAHTKRAQLNTHTSTHKACTIEHAYKHTRTHVFTYYHPDFILLPYSFHCGSQFVSKCLVMKSELSSHEQFFTTRLPQTGSGMTPTNICKYIRLITSLNDSFFHTKWT